jgi:hypothetical protein
MIIPKNIAGQNDKSIIKSENIYDTVKYLDNLYSFRFEDLTKSFNNDNTLNDFVRGLEKFKIDETLFDSFFLAIPPYNKFASFYQRVNRSHLEWKISHSLGIITTREIDTKILLHFILNIIKGNSQELMYNNLYERILSVEMMGEIKKVKIIKDYLHGIIMNVGNLKIIEIIVKNFSITLN